jgi:hypothetical protein
MFSDNNSYTILKTWFLDYYNLISTL